MLQYANMTATTPTALSHHNVTDSLPNTTIVQHSADPSILVVTKTSIKYNAHGGWYVVREKHHERVADHQH